MESRIKDGETTIVLRCCDVMEGFAELEDESVDLIIADPPYNSKIKWDRKDDEWQFEWLEEAKRVLKEGGSIYVFFAPLNMYGVEGWIRRNLTLKNVLVWFHPNLYGCGLRYGTDRYKLSWEVVFYAVKGERAKHGKYIAVEAYKRYGRGMDVFNIPAPIPRYRLGQKPLKLIMRFVDLSSEPGDTVLDPFFGTGTTAVACKILGRNFIGFDNDPECLKIAVERVKKARRRRGLLEVLKG